MADFVPAGMTLDSVLSAMDHGELDLPAFDRLGETHNGEQLRYMNAWAEPQDTINAIMRHHGPAGVARVLRGIAKASVAQGVAMAPRIRSIAIHHGFIS